MIGAAFAAALAVAAIHDTTSALPGTSLRFGMESSRFGATQGFQPTSRAQPPGGQERSGAMRFFGIDATATLTFLDRRLVQADFVIEGASPRQFSYIEDDLVRRGYRRGVAGRVVARSQCVWCGAVRVVARSQCVWSGATRVELSREGGRITATIRPLLAAERGTPQAAAAAPPGGAGVPAAGMPMHPDTLALPPGWTREDFLVASAPEPVYPPEARAAGVQGVVRMLALVDTVGAVMDVQVTRSIAELDSAAVAVVRGMRFRPFEHGGRRVGGWVRVPVTFTLFGP